MSADREAWTQWAEKHPNPRAPLRNKYGAHRVELDGIASTPSGKPPAMRELQLLVAAGEITDARGAPGLRPHGAESHDRRPALGRLNSARSGCITPTSNIGTCRTGNVIVEDVKSKPTSTEAYKLRKKHVEAQYRIVIVEVT